MNEIKSRVWSAVMLLVLLCVLTIGAGPMMTHARPVIPTYRVEPLDAAPALYLPLVAHEGSLLLVQVGSGSTIVQENVGTVNIIVSLTSAVEDAVTVEYATIDGDARAGPDYAAARGTLTFAPGQVSARISVSIVDDPEDEPDEAFSVTLSDARGVVLGPRSTAQVTIADDDPPPAVQWESSGIGIGEGAGNVTATAVLSAASAKPISVEYVTSDGTARAAGDYGAARGTLRFAPGETRASVSLSILDDAVDEVDETFSLALENPDNALLGEIDTAMVTISDDDPTPTVQWTGGAFEANEGAGSETIALVLSAPSAQTISVHYATSDGTAQAGSDYQASSGTLTLVPGETSQALTITVTDDALDEPDQAFYVTLSAPDNALLGALTGATVTIVDDDPPPVVQFKTDGYSVREDEGAVSVPVALSMASEKPVAVGYATSDGTAQAGADYGAMSGTLTFSPGEVNQQVTVNIQDDPHAESDETFRLALGDPNNATLGALDVTTVTIGDDDGLSVLRLASAQVNVSEGAGTATVAVTLDPPAQETVTVSYATADGTAQAGKDYDTATGTLSFAPGLTRRTISIAIVDDSFDELGESFYLALSGPVNAALGAPDTTTVTIADDDPPPQVQWSSASYTVREDAGQARLNVVLSAAAEAPVTVQYATSDGTARAGSDYQARSGTLTFAPGETSQAVDVTIDDDDAVEPDETFSLELSGPTHATLGPRNRATVTIVNEDQLLTVQLERDSYAVGEGAGTVAVVATLSAAAGGPVTVNYATADGSAQAGSDYDAAQGTLTFSAGSTRRSITLSIVDDSDDESGETFHVQLSTPSNATLGAPDAAIVTITDNDDPPPPPPPPSGPSSFGLQIAALHQFAPDSGVRSSENLRLEANPAAYTRLTDALRDSGAGWARVYVNWAQVQPDAPVPGQPPVYYWQWYDDRLRPVAGTGVKLLVTVANAPAWAADRACAPIYPSRLDEFAQFLTDLVNRYKAAPYRIHHWELLNEPDFDGSRGDMVGKACWGNDPDRYVEMLEAAYPAIKRADGQAQVILGGLGHDEFTEDGGPFVRYFPDGVMEHGGAAYLDALNIHYFTAYHDEWERWTPEDPPTCGIVDDGRGTPYDGFGIDAIAKITHFRNRMSVCHSVRKPLWVTEMGVSGRPGNPSSLARQARYVIQGSVRALAAGAEHVTWFALTAPNDVGDHLDLLYEDWTPKPSFYAYQALTSELTGYSHVRTLSVSRVEGYVFEDAGGRERTVAWGRGTLTFRPANRLRVVDREGVESFVRDGSSLDEDGAQNGAIELQLSDNPVFVTVVE